MAGAFRCESEAFADVIKKDFDLEYFISLL